MTVKLGYLLPTRESVMEGAGSALDVGFSAHSRASTPCGMPLLRTRLSVLVNLDLLIVSQLPKRRRYLIQLLEG